MPRPSETQFYGLPLFAPGDPADLRDKWNQAMNTIDQRLHIIETKLNENR